jgi:hypothetical protein
MVLCGLPCLGGLITAGCGAGVAGVVVASAGDDGSNAASTLSDLEVTGIDSSAPKKPPARIQFVLRDQESDSQAVDLLYTLPTPPGQERSITQLASLPATFASSPDGVEHELSWAFDHEDGIPADGSLIEGVQVIARLRRAGTSVIRTVQLGNDAPVVQMLPTLAEVRGVAPVRFVVRDSSDDLVDVRVEYFDFSEPSAGWRLARPGGIDASASTPELAFRGVQAPRLGAELVFFWDTDRDLGAVDRQVQLRCTAIDPVVDGEPVATLVFGVDNNSEPIVQIQEGSLVASEDGRRGIPVHYRVLDSEGDPIRVLFQWRYESEPEFADLGTTDPAELVLRLRDREFRQSRRICSAFPRLASGRALPVDELHVRLPEATATGKESWVFDDGAAGLELMLRRPRLRPTGQSAGWPSNPLAFPVAALPLDGGVSALVLDTEGIGSRVVEVELATGRLARTVASSLAGQPSAMTFAFDGHAVLVATQESGLWRLHEIGLGGGDATMVAEEGPIGPPGPLRAMAAQSRRSVLAVIGNGVWRVDWSGASGSRRRLLKGGLAEPSGLVLDPVRDGRAYVAERLGGGTGRVVSLELATGAVEEVVALAPSAGEPAFPAPESLAYRRATNELVVLCQPAGPSRELRAVALDVASPRAFTIGAVPATATGLAVDGVDLTLTTVPSSNDVVVDGGVEQRRSFVSFDARTGLAAVDRPFAPEVRQQHPWQIGPRDPFQAPLPGAPGGALRTFLWDSKDAAAGGGIRLRALCFDVDGGIGFETATPHVVQQGLDVVPEVLAPAGAHLLEPRACDLDHDGDQDLLVADFAGQTVLVYLQVELGTFAPPIVLSGGHWSPLVVDIDADADLDVVAAGGFGLHHVSIWLQGPPGTFAAPVSVGVSGVTDGIAQVTAADLDRDGDIDLVTANFSSASTTALYQTAPLVFSQPVSINAPGAGFTTARDIDADGDMDLLHEGSFSLVAILQDRNGRFFQGHVFKEGGVAFGAMTPGLSDVDGDGRLDVVAVNGSSGHVLVFAQTARGVFAAPLEVGDTARFGTVTAADVDDDGDMDLVSDGGSHLTVFTQLAPGSFAPPVLLGGPGLTDGPDFVTASDLDGDGRRDLLAANNGGRGFVAFYQVDPGTFSPAAPFCTTGFDRPMLQPVVADQDGDGRPDVIATTGNRGQLVLCQQGASGSFASPLVIGGPAVSSQVQEVRAVDLDTDRDLDLVCANYGVHQVSVFRQQALGSFSAPTLLFQPGGLSDVRNVQAADMDEDGDLDLVCSTIDHESEPHTAIFAQGPGGAFSAPRFVAPGLFASAMTVVDLDADELEDLVIVDSNAVSVVFQNAPAVFTVPQTLGGPGITDGAFALVAADLDGDGDLDLISANRARDNVTVFFQQPARSFSPELALGGSGVTRNLVDLSVADLDADGSLDIVVSGSRGLTVFFQRGPGLYPHPTLLGFAAGIPINHTAVDLDGDGDLDLVCNTTSGNLIAYLQVAPASFAPPIVLTQAVVALELPIPVDLDRDGDLDFACATDTAIHLLFQTSPGVLSAPRAVPGSVVTFLAALTVGDLDRDGDHDLVAGCGDDVRVFFGGR